MTNHIVSSNFVTPLVFAWLCLYVECGRAAFRAGWRLADRRMA